jgi:hypothetical protein
MEDFSLHWLFILSLYNVDVVSVCPSSCSPGRPTYLVASCLIRYWGVPGSNTDQDVVSRNVNAEPQKHYHCAPKSIMGTGITSLLVTSLVNHG